MKIDDFIALLESKKNLTTTDVFIRGEDGKYYDPVVEFHRMNKDGEPPHEYDNDRPMTAVIAPDAVAE